MENATQQEELVLTLRDKPDDLLFTLNDINLRCYMFEDGYYFRCSFKDLPASGYFVLVS